MAFGEDVPADRDAALPPGADALPARPEAGGLHGPIEQLRRLADALAAARSPLEVAQATLSAGVLAAGAPMGTIGLLIDRGRAFELLASAGYAQAPLAGWRRFANEPGLPIADVVTRRRPVLVSDRAELQHRYPRAGAWADRTGYCAAAVYPLLGGEGGPGDVLGFIGFDYDRPQRFTQQQRDTFELLARLCAQSMDRALAHEAERRAREAAEAACRAKDEFLSCVSHELRTPLNAILGWARLLRGGRLDAAQTLHGIESIERNAREQAYMVDALIDATRLAAGDVQLAMQPLQLADVIGPACEAMRPCADAKGVALDRGPLAPLPPVRGDPGRIEQIVRLLLANAIKFTPAGGRIRIDAQPKEAQVELSVQDTGRGIEPQFLPHVFDCFRQADSSITREHGGLGLGLSIVRRLTELHRGTVRAHSPGPDAGATFVVALPVARLRQRPAG